MPFGLWYNSRRSDIWPLPCLQLSIARDMGKRRCASRPLKFQTETLPLDVTIRGAWPPARAACRVPGRPGAAPPVSENQFSATISLRKSEAVLWSSSSLDRGAPVAPRAAAALRLQAGGLTRLKTAWARGFVSTRHGFGAGATSARIRNRVRGSGDSLLNPQIPAEGDICFLKSRICVRIASAPSPGPLVPAAAGGVWRGLRGRGEKTIWIRV